MGLDEYSRLGDGMKEVVGDIIFRLPKFIGISNTGRIILFRFQGRN